MSRPSYAPLKPRMIKVTCIDNGKSVDGQVIDHFPDRLVVELPTGIRLVMRPHHTQKSIYLASYGGMEFECNTRTEK